MAICGDVVDDHRLQVGEGDVGQEPTLRLDLAGDREAVPERLAEAVAQQDPALVDGRRHGRRRATTSRRRAPRRHATKRLAPGVERLLASPGPGAVGRRRRRRTRRGPVARVSPVVAGRDDPASVPARCRSAACPNPTAPVCRGQVRKDRSVGGEEAVDVGEQILRVVVRVGEAERPLLTATVLGRAERDDVRPPPDSAAECCRPTRGARLRCGR